jgi:predicted acetyltransferase
MVTKPADGPVNPGSEPVPYTCNRVAGIVRAVADSSEFVQWVAAAQVAFHLDRSAHDEAAYRRDVLDQDLSRTLAALDGERVVGTLYSFATPLTLPGGAHVTTDAIAAVSVLPSHRRRGFLTQLMHADLRVARDRGDVAAILYPSEYPIYGRFGFGPATERADYSLDRGTARFTHQTAGSVDLVDAAQLAEVAPNIFESFRRHRPGQISRNPRGWGARLGLRETPWSDPNRRPRCALFSSPAGEPTGYALYRVEPSSEHHVPTSTLRVNDLIALTPDAYLGLWRFVCEVDLVRQVSAGMRCVEEPLAWLLDNPRAALQLTTRTDDLWLRPLDVPALLSARRYATPAQLVLAVDDPLGMSGGRFKLEGGPDGATCRPTQEQADLSMSLTALGALSLGGVSLRLLHASQAIDEHTKGAVDTGDRFFRWPTAPWCSTHF